MKKNMAFQDSPPVDFKAIQFTGSPFRKKKEPQKKSSKAKKK